MEMHVYTVSLTPDQNLWPTRGMSFLTVIFGVSLNTGLSVLNWEAYGFIEYQNGSETLYVASKNISISISIHT